MTDNHNMLARREILGRLVAGTAALSVSDAAWGAEDVPASAGSARALDTLVLVPGMFGAKGDGEADDTAAFRRLLSEAVGSGLPIWIPPGRYRVTQPLEFKTAGNTSGPIIIGAGSDRTVIGYDFAEGADTPLLNIDGASAKPYSFMRGGVLQGLHIKPISLGRNAGAQGPAIAITGWWMHRLEHLVIEQIKGDGIQFVRRENINANPDATASCLGRIQGVEISNCAGWGINGAAGLGWGGAEIVSCRIGLNGEGGIRCAGHNISIRQSSIWGNGSRAAGPGVLVERIDTNPNSFTLENCELDSNVGAHLHVSAGWGGLVAGNRFNSWATLPGQNGRLTPRIHIALGGGSSRSSVLKWLLDRNYHRSQWSGSAARGAEDQDMICYDFSDDPNVSDIEVRRALVPAPDNTPLLRAYSRRNATSRLKLEVQGEAEASISTWQGVALTTGPGAELLNSQSPLPFTTARLDPQKGFVPERNGYRLADSAVCELLLRITVGAARSGIPLTLSLCVERNGAVQEVARASYSSTGSKEETFSLAAVHIGMPGDLIFAAGEQKGPVPMPLVGGAPSNQLIVHPSS